MKTVVQNQQTEKHSGLICGGLPVRTQLRAGLAWDDLDDQAKALWGKLTSAVSSATSSTPTTPPAA